MSRARHDSGGWGVAAAEQTPRPRRVLLGALGAMVALGVFLTMAGLVTFAAGSGVPGARAGSSVPEGRKGLGLVLRTSQHLQRPGDAIPLVERLVARGVNRAWVQVKQDENDEFRSGTLFYPSRIAPVAPGHGDGRLGAFIGALATRGIEPLAWMPVLHDAQAAAAHPDWRSQRITRDGRLVVQKDWLCPFDPAVQRHQASIAREVVARFPKLQGLYLDFIRYDDDYSCACPECLAELEARTSWRERKGRALLPRDIRNAGAAQNSLWTAWNDLRAEKIVDTINTIRDAVEEVRPDFRIGAFALPFSSQGYEVNTESGQDVERMARAGLDEIVLMGYWDDWDRDPAWVRKGLDAAARLVDGEADLTVVLDGDMGVRRTRRTLEALGPWAPAASWFNYGNWSEHEFRRLARAIDGHRREGPMPRPDHVSVVIRVDTEPDYRPSYKTVHPKMIDTLVEMFAEEKVTATFMTVGKLAQLQTAAVKRAAAAGHEIGSHANDHEQLDSLPVEQQVAAVDGGLAVLDRLGFEVHGFGAPRNSITEESRDRLMDWNLEYDGSDAYDPMRSLVDVRYESYSEGLDNRILVIPFVMPNEWDARYVGTMSANEMVDAWTRRLDKVVESGEPVFVLDVHQWAISKPDNLEALRSFIRYAKACAECRIETLRDAARHARSVLDRYELPGTTSGDTTVRPEQAGASATPRARS